MATKENKSPIERINPKGLHANPAFSQAILVEGGAKTLYIGGQNAVNEKGDVVGDRDFGAQVEQAVKNIATVLEAAEAGWDNVVKCTIYMVPDQPLHAGFEAFQKVVGKDAKPPTISVLVVSGLANPEFLVEVEAIAVLP